MNIPFPRGDKTKPTLNAREQEQFEQAAQLREFLVMPGWDKIESLLADIAQRQYPNPKDKKYDMFPWKNLEKDYAIARGGTEVVKEFLLVMRQQDEIYENLRVKKEKGNVRNYQI